MNRFETFVAIFLVAFAFIGLSAANAAPVVADVQIAPGATSTRIKLIASEPVSFTVFVLANPDRLIVEGPDINFQLPPESGSMAEGPIASYRYGSVSPERSRIVFDLANPVLPGDIVTTPSDGGGAYSIALYLTNSDRKSFEKAVKTVAEARLKQDAAPAQTSLPAVDNRPLIVIDPGHGGNDLGATGTNGLFEKDVVLAFALALAKKIEAQGLCRVALTRTQDVFIPLDDRVKFARQRGASVFLSIHGDTITASNEIRGATVYIGDDKSSDADAARVAEYENKSDLAGGVVSKPTDSTIADILGDLTHRETRIRSSLLAREIVTRIADTTHLNHNPLRAAGFRVLRAFDIPAALIEIGYMSSKSDLDQFTSPQWTDRMANRISDALYDFLLSSRNGGTVAQDTGQP
jgi:N-acetylmuramoyl-L-alanine amidase